MGCLSICRLWMLRARIFRHVWKFLEGVKRRKIARSRRKLVLDDRASGTAFEKQRGFLEAVLSSVDRRLTLRAAAPRIYSISSSSSFRSFSISLHPSSCAYPPRHPPSLFLSRARLSSRRRAQGAGMLIHVTRVTLNPDV